MSGPSEILVRGIRSRCQENNSAERLWGGAENKPSRASVSPPTPPPPQTPPPLDGRSPTFSSQAAFFVEALIPFQVLTGSKSVSDQTVKTNKQTKKTATPPPPIC